MPQHLAPIVFFVKLCAYAEQVACQSCCAETPWFCKPGEDFSSGLRPNADSASPESDKPGDVTSCGSSQASAFHVAAAELYDSVAKAGQNAVTPSRTFNVSSWAHAHAANGGLTDLDRLKLAELYGSFSSVFESGTMFACARARACIHVCMYV